MVFLIKGAPTVLKRRQAGLIYNFAVIYYFTKEDCLMPANMYLADNASLRLDLSPGPSNSKIVEKITTYIKRKTE